MGEVIQELLGQVLFGFELAASEQAPVEHAEPDFDLVEPAAMLGRVVDHVFVLGIGQEGAALAAGLECLRVEGNAAQLGNGPAKVQTPMGVEVVHDPVNALDVRKLLGHVAKVPTEIDRGAPSQDIADHPTVGTARVAIKQRVPWRMYSNSRKAGIPGRAGLVSYLGSRA